MVGIATSIQELMMDSIPIQEYGQIDYEEVKFFAIRVVEGTMVGLYYTL